MRNLGIQHAYFTNVAYPCASTQPVRGHILATSNSELNPSMTLQFKFQLLPRTETFIMYSTLKCTTTLQCTEADYKRIMKSMNG